MILEGKKANIVAHSAQYGDSRTGVRMFKIYDPQPYKQYESSVSILFTEAKNRRQATITMVPDNDVYYTIEVDGKGVVFDSRDHVPCNMAEWHATSLRHSKLRQD